MQSRVITIDATRVTMEGTGWTRRASGEPIQCYTFRREDRTCSRGGGVILRLDDYREPASPAEIPTPVHKPQRGCRLGLVLECVATAAIVVLTLGTLVRFFVF